MKQQNSIRVRDPVVRLFHWTLVPAFFLAYLTEENLLAPHVWAGYAVFGLIIFGLFWVFTGSNTARFSSFVYRPRVVLSYLKDTLRLKAPHYVGHKPVGGVMIILLLISIVLTSLKGLHEFSAIFALLLVIIHVAGVVPESVIHRENLVRSMFTGYKRRLQP